MHTQELCQASMADALEASFFHDKVEKKPIMVSPGLEKARSW
jgi:hypothetical protein